MLYCTPVGRKVSLKKRISYNIFGSRNLRLTHYRHLTDVKLASVSMTDHSAKLPLETTGFSHLFLDERQLLSGQSQRTVHHIENENWLMNDQYEVYPLGSQISSD